MAGLFRRKFEDDSLLWSAAATYGQAVGALAQSGAVTSATTGAQMRALSGVVYRMSTQVVGAEHIPGMFDVHFEQFTRTGGRALANDSNIAGVQAAGNLLETRFSSTVSQQNAMDIGYQAVSVLDDFASRASSEDQLAVTGAVLALAMKTLHDDGNALKASERKMTLAFGAEMGARWAELVLEG
jgi:hypothetical protein